MITTTTALRQVTVTVNGRSRTASIEPRTTLGDFLRDDLNLKSVHYGCHYGVCGSCTVLVDGESVRACTMLAVEADGRSVETVESLSSDPRELHPIQQAFTENFGLQCGFCTPAMVLRTKEMLESGDGQLTREQIRHELSGIICRCTGYQQIVDAVEAAQQAHGDGRRPSQLSAPSAGENEDSGLVDDAEHVGESAYNEDREG